MPMILTGSFLSRDVPSSAALPIIRPALLRQHSMSDRAKLAMQGYLNHFLSNLDIVNSREVYVFNIYVKVILLANHAENYCIILNCVHASFFFFLLM